MLERHIALIKWCFNNECTCQYLFDILETFTSTTHQFLNFQLNFNFSLRISSTQMQCLYNHALVTRDMFIKTRRKIKNIKFYLKNLQDIPWES